MEETDVVAEAERIVAFSPEMRLPEMLPIVRANRQQRRRLALHPGVCRVCGQTAIGGNTVCLYGGKDAHIECAVTRNVELKKLQRQLAAQDARDKGTTWPTMPMELMTPSLPRLAMWSPRSTASRTARTGS